MKYVRINYIYIINIKTHVFIEDLTHHTFYAEIFFKSDDYTCMNKFHRFLENFFQEGVFTPIRVVLTEGKQYHSKKNFVNFYFSIESLEVFVPGRKASIVDCTDVDFSDVKYVAFSHYGQTESEYYFDCPQNITDAV